MNEYLKEHPERAFISFYKVYIYGTNKGKWTELSQEDKDSPGFKWDVSKAFFLSKRRITAEDVKNHFTVNGCKCEGEDPEGTTNTKCKKSKLTKDYVIYGGIPLTGYDAKLLLNVIGLRMLHFVES